MEKSEVEYPVWAVASEVYDEKQQGKSEDRYDHYRVEHSARTAFDYDLGNNHNMSVYYSGYTRQPSIYDLLSVPDYTNPLNITMGNPGLKPAFGQSISVNYRGGNMEKQEMLYCGLRYNNTINDISRKRTYDEKSGVYTSRPENINGNWGIGGNIYYTNKLFKKFSLVLLPMQIITGGFRMCR